ncbi:uncharacterized protein BcabD6B2_19130 [Babesia caballi]|uniref:Secreted protein n=1 Tax=Babesia caballi TaxID=5871 RepID=A0AAV4LRR4_BABCB|nr:hypothetical protein BcabD6B2_19130 [Babesia caballi]
MSSLVASVPFSISFSSKELVGIGWVSVLVASLPSREVGGGVVMSIGFSSSVVASVTVESAVVSSVLGSAVVDSAAVASIAPFSSPFGSVVVESVEGVSDVALVSDVAHGTGGMAGAASVDDSPAAASDDAVAAACSFNLAASCSDRGMPSIVGKLRSGNGADSFVSLYVPLVFDSSFGIGSCACSCTCSCACCSCTCVGRGSDVGSELSPVNVLDGTSVVIGVSVGKYSAVGFAFESPSTSPLVGGTDDVESTTGASGACSV